jgi:hypothetical protein
MKSEDIIEFGNEKIRRIWHKKEWYFSVVIEFSSI